MPAASTWASSHSLASLALTFFSPFLGPLRQLTLQPREVLLNPAGITLLMAPNRLYETSTFLLGFGFGTTVEAIIALNPGLTADSIDIGDTIRIPAPP